MADPRNPAGLFVALRNAALTLIAMGQTRLELVGNELQTEKLRLIRQLALVLAAFICGAFGVLLMMALTTLLFWEQRVWVVGTFTVLFLGLAAYFYHALQQSNAQSDAPFETSLAELQRDLAQLKAAVGEQNAGRPD